MLKILNIKKQCKCHKVEKNKASLRSLWPYQIVFRRRRPAYNTDDMLSVSVDKFSFPSGHASRVAGLMFFFTLLYPLNIILQVPIVLWAVAVMISRVTLGRHHILDVFGGLLVGYLEYLITAAIWMDKETAGSWAEYFGAEDPWSSAWYDISEKWLFYSEGRIKVLIGNWYLFFNKSKCMYVVFISLLKMSVFERDHFKAS